MKLTWSGLLRRQNETAKAAVEQAMTDHTDPKLALQMGVREMQTQLEHLTEAASVVIADSERAEQRAGQLSRQIDAWKKSAKTALDNGRDDDARAIAHRIASAQRQLDSINEQLPGQKAAADEARSGLEAFKLEMRERMDKRAELLNEEDQAAHNEAVTAAMKSFSDLTGSTVNPSFDEVEDRIHDHAAKAKADASLRGSDPHIADMEMHVRESNDEADAVLADLKTATPVEDGGGMHGMDG